MKFLIVTGMSGAGKSNAVNCLEDIGFFCIDNMPLRLINPFMELAESGGMEVTKAAFVIDIRGNKFFDDFDQSIEAMREEKKDFKILFLEASEEVLIRRYKETRRTHPMSRGGSLQQGIRREKERLDHIRQIADYVIDTSDMTPAQLKGRLSDLFDNEAQEWEKKFTISIVSFGYKHGMPLEADNVFDMRFIPNPYYIESMKNRTGNDREVREYVMKWPESQQFRDTYGNLIRRLIPHYIKQGKSDLVLAFGCTGGRHRSVSMANEFYELLKEEGYRVNLTHRDL